MENFPYNNQIGESEEFYSFQETLRKAASVDRSVLLIGERGSGKEFAASRLHYLSSRWNKSFVKLNCAALPPSLIETELFGHVKGAYTGADRERKGRFEEADGGTLFLDEIGLIPFEVQEKILRVVEYGTFERVGSSETKEINVRILGAANQDLPTLCREGKFKQDLLDRLSFEVLFVPPLRARGDDIFVLADHFAQKMGRELGRKGRISFSNEVIQQLKSYSWPGNIRELKNTVERAVYRAEGNYITEIVLNPFINPYLDDKGDKGTEDASPASYQGTEETDAAGPGFKKSCMKQSQPYPDPESFDDFFYLTDSSNEVLIADRRNSLKKSESGFSTRLLNSMIKQLISSAAEITADKEAADFGVITDIVKKQLILSALDDAQNNQKTAASLLNLSYDQFRGSYRKYFT